MELGIELIAIKACILVSLFPYFVTLTNFFISNKLLKILLFAFFILISIYLKSRLFFLGILLTFYLNYFKNIKPTILITISFIVIILLFFINIDSVLGRIFIWKICLNNIKINSLFGLGFDSFKSNYAEWQSNYFKMNPCWSKFHFIADAPSFAYNELLNYFIEFGVFSVIIFLGIIYINLNILNKTINIFYRNVVISNLIILLFCFFSFPLHNLFICTIFICNHLILFLTLFKKYNKTCIILCLLISSISSFLFVKYQNAKKEWFYAQLIPKQFKADKFNCYKNVNYLLYKNRYFLSDYCRFLISERYFKKAKILLSLKGKYFNQYEKYMLLGEINMIEKDFKLSKINYQYANNIVPIKLMPLYNLMNISILEKDNSGIKFFSKKIIDQPLKFESVLSNEIKNKASTVYFNITKNY